MREKKLNKYIVITALIFLFLVSISSAEAESIETNYDLGEILVSATKIEQYQAEVGSSTTVITSDQIRKKGRVSVLELLREVPGVSILQSGGVGSVSSIHIRGTKAGHTLVMIDGIKVNDPMISDGAFNFAHLLTVNIERIEVVRGPQSTLYGSAAMGGIVNIITKEGKGDRVWDVSFEGGSQKTYKEQLGVSGSSEKIDYALSILRLDVDGISWASGTDTNEKDAYENTTASAKLGYKVSDSSKAVVVFRKTNAVYDYDDGASADDPNKAGWTNSFMGKVSFDQAINSMWDHKITIGYSKITRKYLDEPDEIDAGDDTHNWFSGNTRNIEWQHNVYPVDSMTITSGFEYEENYGVGDGRQSWNRFDEKTVYNRGYYLQNQLKFFENLYITPGIRVDENQNFGTATTYKISTSYILPKTGTRFMANWGTGFKAPTLFQLYSSYGTLTLSPERNESYDIGFEQALLNNKLNFGATYFNNYFDNMVEYDFATSKYGNIDNAEMEGIETVFSYDLLENLSIDTNYTYTRTKDRDSGKELLRRPKHQAVLSLDWNYIKKGNINLSSNYIGGRWNDSANTERLKTYVTVDIRTSYNLNDNIELFFKIDNIADRDYHQVLGYSNPGRSFFGGFHGTF